MSHSVESMDTETVGEFLTGGAQMRGNLHEKLATLERLQSQVSEACVFASGDLDGPKTVDTMLNTMKALETFADGVRGDITNVEQQEQFDKAGVTVIDDGSFTIMTSGDDDEVEVHELADGRLVVYVNGNEIELTEEQTADFRIETGAGDDTVAIGINVATGITVVGGSGADRIVGGSGDDDLDGGSGNDTISGRAGDDRILGGSGSDEISGGSGDDTIRGQHGNDTIVGGSGDDTIYGQQGDDQIRGGSGDDQVYGGSGDDTIDGGSGADELQGNEGNDTIDGGSGADELQGNEGNDTIDGGSGADELQGNEGNDTIIGDSREDTFDNGTGDTVIDQKPEPIEEAPPQRPWYDPTPLGPNIDLPNIETPAWVEEGMERLDEYGEYLGEANDRRVERDGNFWFTRPGRPFDALFEDGVAAVGIIGLDGELYHGDDGGFCGRDHSCITGVSTPQGGAITLGHTVLYDRRTPDPDTVAHEQQHVYQYETYGTLGFAQRWVNTSLVDLALGGDGYYDTEHEREGYFVQDNFDSNDPNTYPTPDLEVPDDYYPTTAPGSTRRYQRGINEGGTFDDRGISGRISAEIGKVIWF